MEAQVATGELLAAIDTGTLDATVARDLEGRGAELQNGLALAVGIGNVGAVLAIADECGVLFGDEVKLVAAQDLLGMACQGDWGNVAYQLALANERGTDFLDERFRAYDFKARKDLRQLAGEVKVQIPRDLRLTFARTGKLGPTLLVEQPRWLLPRPTKDQCFITMDGSRLEEGWYIVVEYPIGDNLKEAVLRRRYWDGFEREDAAHLLQTVGETLLCKAAKAAQWKLVEWAVQRWDGQRLAEQLQTEYMTLWDSMERSAYLHSHLQLSDLCSCLDAVGVLSKHWRYGPLLVPKYARLVAPSMEALQDALALDALCMEALRLVGGSKVTFALPQVDNAQQAWQSVLVSIGGRNFAYPLLHRAAEAGFTELMTNLLQAMVNAEACDSRGRTALAVAASVRQWGAMDVLLSEGCRVEGYSGASTISVLQAACQPGAYTTYEELDQTSALLERALKREQRAPALTLAEYFARQARGEVVLGMEPRRFKPEGTELKLRNGSLRVSSFAVLLDCTALDNDVCFIAIGEEAYATVADSRIIDIKGRTIYSEQQLIKQSIPLAIAVAVPCGQLLSDGADQLSVVPAKHFGALAGMLPLVARAPPPGGLNVESMTSCCGEFIGRIEVVVDGVSIGETQDSGIVDILLPPKEFEVHAELSGRRLLTECITGSPEACLIVKVNVSVFVYVVMIDQEEQLEFVSVCGHRRDIPEDARPFIGTVVWDQGSQRLNGVQPAVLGNEDCLARCRTMQFVPDLPPGRLFEAVEWEDTSSEDSKACQFQRLLTAPVRVGKIYNG